MAKQARSRAERANRSIPRPLAVAFAAPALCLLALLLLPLGALLFALPPSALWDTLRDPVVLFSFALTIGAALIATTIAIVFGIPLAYLLARSNHRAARWLEAAIDLPLVLPHTAAGLALLMCFGRQSALGKGLDRFGLGITNHPLGIVLAMTFVSAPYLIGAAREAFARVDRRLENLARTLGASPWHTFRRVTLPLAAPGIATGMAQMWARGVSEFGAIMIVSYHPRVIPVLLWDRFETGGLRAASPLAALTVIAALLLLTAARLLAARLPHTAPAR